MRFTQPDVEKELSDAIPFGMREEIARGTGIYPKIVDAYFNPNDERKSPHFQVLHIQSVLDERDPSIGDAVWDKLNALRDAGRPVTLKTAELDIDRELGNLSKDITEVIVAKCEGKPLTAQLEQIAEAKRQIDIYEQAVIGGGSLLRSIARDAVKQFRAANGGRKC